MSVIIRKIALVTRRGDACPAISPGHGTYNPSVNSLSLDISKQSTYPCNQRLAAKVDYACLPLFSPLFPLASLKYPLK